MVELVSSMADAAPADAKPADAKQSDGAERAIQARRLTVPKLATIVFVAAILYFAKDVFLPLSIAILVTFALSPPVARLRKLGLPHLATVLAVVSAAFIAAALFFVIVASQLSVLARNLPVFQANLITKVESLREASSEDGVFRRLSNMISAVNDEITEAMPAEEPAAGPGAPVAKAAEPEPLPVRVVDIRSPVVILQDLVVPLITPIATAGLVVIVVIFMLLEREELRDRFIRLVGSSDLHRTTQVLEEAGQRVGTYLLVQLLVNVIYAIPIGVGLWLIGIPNALLWGMLTLVLRFVPYIGSILAAVFPVFLAFAVSPDWVAVGWTIALFVTIELITSNLVEPWLYGSRTGIRPLAIIISAIFWTWLWGPLGLVLSTPMTVCLVVLGRHLPQFELFDILFGDEAVLAPHARLYQRLLAGDVIESASRAEEALEETFLAEYYRDIGIPALLIAQNDYGRGVLTPDQEERVAKVAQDMVVGLQDVVAEELEGIRAATATATATEIPDAAATEPTAEDPAASRQATPGAAEVDTRLDGEGYRVVCIGGRTRLDDVSAAMLAQALQAEGAEAAYLPRTDLAPSRFRTLEAGENDCVILCFLDPAPSRASLLHVRRIKRTAPNLRVGVVIWEMPKELEQSEDVATLILAVPKAKLQEVLDLGADFVATDFESAFDAAFSRAEPKPLVATHKRPLRSHTRRRHVVDDGLTVT